MKLAEAQITSLSPNHDSTITAPDSPRRVPLTALRLSLSHVDGNPANDTLTVKH